MSDVVVVGGGAAGLMAAIFAGRNGASVTLLEGSRACGLKILISGGGRCNLLPTASDPSDFFTSGSRNVLRRLFRTWPLEEVTDFFERDLAIPLIRDEAQGKVFPKSESARTVRDGLVAAAREAGAEIHEGYRVTGLERQGNGFVVRGTRDGRAQEIETGRLILASGGLSLPKTGSDGAGFALAKGLGHGLVERYPALVPLTSPDPAFGELAGVSVRVLWQALAGEKVLEERERELLFTHRGYSGPAILDASHWVVRDGAKLRVAWGGFREEAWQRHFKAESRKRMDVLLSEVMPRRLAELILERAELKGRMRATQLNPSQWRRLMPLLTAFDLPVDGNQGYGKAEVTGGGLPLSEVNPSTLESRRAASLFLCGEIFDVIGRIGGFNFLWAWITGRLAGESAAARSKAPA
ncbi:MAG: aminoacetone oxidase family FAD-binding enzyme [Deltaproteobacteria bacterium]|nr:aminoacetone oxidase family FAD-binding enzyme [Deltaproteobacteria bacterium]MBW2394036.1 aminoacetone oxidase family FAD-binding enzyme [Deltaproteobacteria bacterium]